MATDLHLQAPAGGWPDCNARARGRDGRTPRWAVSGSPAMLSDGWRGAVASRICRACTSVPRGSGRADAGVSALVRAWAVFAFAKEAAGEELSADALHIVRPGLMVSGGPRTRALQTKPDRVLLCGGRRTHGPLRRVGLRRVARGGGSTAFCGPRPRASAVPLSFAAAAETCLRADEQSSFPQSGAPPPPSASADGPPAPGRRGGRCSPPTADTSGFSQSERLLTPPSASADGPRALRSRTHPHPTIGVRRWSLPLPGGEGRRCFPPAAENAF